jgi:mono/diheme cytochrome c family protein
MMKRACLLALTTATFLAACSTDKAAVSDSLKTNPELASPPGIALPPAATGSQVVPAIEQAPAPSKRIEPSSPAPRPVRAATPKVASVAPAPVVAAPAAKPTVQPTVQPATPAPKVAVVPSPPLQDLSGKAPYEENCRKCHGVIGTPPKAMQAKFPKIATFNAAFFGTHSADSVVTILTKGKNADMKSFKDKLSHAQMVAVAAYIRSFAK